MISLNTIINQELIDKINSFFIKYGIDKDCSDITENIVAISNEQCVGKYSNMKDYSGRYDPKSRQIILISNKLTTRLFLHEYIHKKSANHRLFRQDLLGIAYNKNYIPLNEAITEKITCEILDISLEEQKLHPYYSMFVGIEALYPLIPWRDIVLSYFNNDKNIYKLKLEKDLKQYLKHLSKLEDSYPYYYQNLKGIDENTYEKICNNYQLACENIKEIINIHTSS